MCILYKIYLLGNKEHVNIFKTLDYIGYEGYNINLLHYIVVVGL